MSMQESASDEGHMSAVSRPAGRRTVLRVRASVVAAAALAGGAAVFASLPGGSAPVSAGQVSAGPVSAGPVSAAAAGDAMAVRSAGPGVTGSRMTTAVHRAVAVLEERAVRRPSRTARHRHLAVLAAARLARQQAAQEQAAQRAARQRAQAAVPPSPPSPGRAPMPSPPASAGPGGDAASSALGICIRHAEEGGSYAWGPGNGGGAYQFVLGTWEAYGGAGGEYGVAGAAYQDQIFDNAIAAGGASNWIDYDGC
jgi:hypothetical protein